jgi:hypothetical protein
MSFPELWRVTFYVAGILIPFFEKDTAIQNASESVGFGQEGQVK